MPNKMPNNKNNGDARPHKQSFTVKDELSRDSHIRRTVKVRSAKRMAYIVASLLLVAGSCVLLAAIILLTAFRASGTVTVTGNSFYSDDAIISASGIDEKSIVPLLRDGTVLRKIRQSCPYVENVEIVKQYPSSVTIKVTETYAYYYTVAKGRVCTLNKALTVIEYSDAVVGLCKLILPEIKIAVAQSKVEFVSAESKKYVSAVLEAVEAFEGKFNFTSVDLSDKYGISLIVGENTKIMLGHASDLVLKLSLAEKAYQDSTEAKSRKTLIDVSEPSKMSVTYDFDGDL